ncbi:DedA family protein [Roseomonas stagni]|uniref:DedA family protein n=1 Tax=Falsiroseomonas algicola TaxID=2716930 RepID=A0A6M1LMC3_9PROT|nr:YqaA family protein [Falsiroseomonas algicola]NGM21508.1 DedA family protein [Falsiroseomonas algicola]
MTRLAELIGLFASAFGAASLLPLQSEPVLVGLLLLGETPAWLLVLVASIGNTLGAVLNWWLGRQVDRFRDRRWFPVPPAALDRATGWYHRWGRWSLLLSWAPLIGDPLTLVAGVLREPLPTFLLLVAIAKTARYVVLAWATLSLA